MLVGQEGHTLLEVTRSAPSLANAPRAARPRSRSTDRSFFIEFKKSTPPDRWMRHSANLAQSLFLIFYVFSCRNSDETKVTAKKRRCAMEPVFFASAPPRATTEVRAAAAAGGLATAPYAAAPPPNAHARATTRRTPADTANEETVAAGRAAPTVVRSR